MSLEARIGRECAEIRAEVTSVRLVFVEIEQACPALAQLCASGRMALIGLTAKVNALDTTLGAMRMTGQAPPLTEQKPVEETPLFALPLGRPLEPADLERMRDSLHRAGDHSLDEAEHGEGVAA